MGKQLNYKRDNISRDLRHKIYEQHNGVCQVCNKRLELNSQTTQIDHIIPVLLGGNNEEHNLRLVCNVCNVRRNTYTFQCKSRLLSPVNDFSSNISIKKEKYNIYMSTKEYSLHIGKSEKTVQRYIKSGRIKAYKDSGKIMIPTTANIFKQRQDKVEKQTRDTADRTEEFIDLLKEQIKEKDKQINEKDKQINEFQSGQRIFTSNFTNHP